MIQVAGCKLPFISEIYNCIYSKKIVNKVSIIIFIIIIIIFTVSGTLSNVYLTSNKFGVNIIPPSTKFIQCQTTIRTSLKSSPNQSITHLWKLTKNHTNIQYDQYSATKQVIKSFRDNQENKLTNQLTSQGSFFTSVSRFSLPQVNAIWSTCQSKLPKNIFNFTIRYINNTLPTRKNLARWCFY